MSTPNLSPELFAFHQAFNGGKPITDEAEKHRFTKAFAERAAVIDRRWGRKSRAGEAPISKDTIAYWKGSTVPTVPTDGTVDARDLIRSDGVVQWLGVGSPDYDNIEARWFPMVAAPQPQPEPTPEPEPDPFPIDDLIADVERIANGIETIAATLLTIEGIAKDVQSRGVVLRWR